MSASLVFGPVALAASIARTATLRDAPPAMLARWRDSALAEVEWLIADGSIFTLSQYIASLADAERTSFAGRIGAGVTDLVMNALGYTWRDNAACLSSSLAPHADFIYGDGAVSGHGVVLAEAGGSCAANVTSAAISSQAKRKYNRQVKPYLTTVSPHGKVIHGYSVAFGSRPGVAGAFLHVAETRISKPRLRPTPPAVSTLPLTPEVTPTSLAVAAHRANFSLMDAPSVVSWIDWVRSGGEHPVDEVPVSFLQIPYAGRLYLVCVESLWSFESYPHWFDDLWHDPRWWPRFRRRHSLQQGRDDFAGWFVMEEKAAERFLNALSGIIRSGREGIPEVLELPRFEPVGFAIGPEEGGVSLPDSEYVYALYRDGLALLGSPPRRIVGHRTWSPKEGMQG